ncbi:predicted protein [Nematostella vectensis]|uniref:HAUS augmin-like complex subunit 4 n=1 Tax=Nematostella vectensis TaxID=45351 RepID=A7RRC9_NEMVE|nr:predicted protein [Nematostella vectensis]|eukprot:XP_001637987.1 predicted protein [Nematostella vectensis]
MASVVSVQETVDKLNASLPIFITAAEVENNPEFTKLLFALSRTLTEDGLSRTTHSELTETKDSLLKQKEKYLEAHTVYSELKSLIMEQNISKNENVPSPSTAALYDALSSAISSAEAVHYLSFTPEGSDEITLLGLKQEDLVQNDSHKIKIQQSFQQNIIPELESRLRAKCELLVNFHEPSKDYESEGLSFAKAGQLPAILQKEKSLLQEERKRLGQDRLMRDRQFRQYYQTLLQSLESLEKLITKHRLQSQVRYDKVTTDWLAAKCEAMCLKIRVLQNQLIRDTYTPETVAALKKIRGLLEVAKEEEERELQRAREALQAYESVGMGFEALVREYSALMIEIDNKKWALSELRQSQDGIDSLWSHR